MRVQRLIQMTSNWDVYKTLSRWFMAILLVLILKKQKQKKTEGTVTKMDPSHSSLSKKEKLALSSF